MKATSNRFSWMTLLEGKPTGWQKLLPKYHYTTIYDERKMIRMLKWSMIFLVIALIAGIFGFFNIVAAAASIAKVLFFIFLVLFVISLFAGRSRSL
ncbi:hypothetical protein D1872_286810 [compost metagenome]